MTDVVVVESPAKAKTINKYLGDGYTVLASFGHVRDLPPKDGSVRPDENFAMDWQTDERGAKQIAAITKALKSAKRLYLATDPDREGEAISWHVRSVLEEKKLLRGIDVQRITFNEITKSAIKAAMEAPRDLDMPLIEAYLARRALDYLVGFTLSPVLWRKLPGSRSAGRVQSVALRLICEREAEIEVFKPREYWTITSAFTTPGNAGFQARLTHLAGQKLDQFDLNNEALAFSARDTVMAGSFTVRSVERKRVKRNPPPPFTTSTLQQEASRKLGMSAQTTMRTAQQLYEGVDIGGETIGLITYMRTDGVTMAKEAVTAIRGHIGQVFGGEYVPDYPRTYSTKAKNAQEAHEAVRPTDASLIPEKVARTLTHDQQRLYDLIWKRSVASQMQSAELDQVAIVLADASGQTQMRATGSTIAFDGFLKLYIEGRDDSRADDEDGKLLPPMKEGDKVRTGDVAADQHFTQPPPRYSEASLVKKMEEIGIGRPSTYASILGVLRDRNYVRLETRRFMPEDRGRLVTAFLTSFFERYVDTGFTASLEEQLDDISDGRADWHDVMAAFWHDFSAAVAQTKDLKISDVIDALDEDLSEHFFPPREDEVDPRTCTACGTGRLGLRLGKFGAFIGCSNYPTCQFTRRLVADDEGGETLKDGLKVLGQDPETGEDITVRRGPYGLYIQKGEPNPEDKKAKPKRTTIPKGLEGDKLTLTEALGLLSLPRVVGLHPETGETIEAGLGRFGPYVKMGAIYGTLDKDDDVLTVGLNRAVDSLAKKLASIRNLGAHPKDGEPVMVRKGRFGPYVQHGSMIANLPKDVGMDDITLDGAIALVAEKGKPLKGAAKKGATKKTAAKTTRTKKAAATIEGEDAPKKKAAPRAAAKKTTKTPASKSKTAASKKKTTASENPDEG
ncbi:type I DNA topoisomerase [Gluconobacter wancherniae]|uniref:DNA topoisomerase 1 n=1 Tax=Gluconobacter wancherniae NBRC 103581 TaxID=656744 RepID=A0A511B014_9PROT|nr:type I DNA topoisomerase [Gluconobacter wancherniae]MBF0854370.1 type I DNA topoisomerase [Gluconobacter wancherniae]GBD57432.1 DNA topoisomerase 1 [Gluconobacter wancherniae NBRC 103581]GEK93794.1 DNA topoisomerase 1 [Gluconobacter wancherniae NBRC 103581]